jgi:hypothetical protein
VPQPFPPAPEKRIGAASLPPRTPTRPTPRPAMAPPTVMSRPVTNTEPRDNGDSDAIEIYAPPPASADAPPGLGPSERPGQYSLRRQSQRMSAVPVETPRERSTGSIAAIPAGLARPGRSAGMRTSPPSDSTSTPTPTPSSQFTQTQPVAQRPRPPATSAAVETPPAPAARPPGPIGPRMAGPVERARSSTYEPVKGRTPTPSRVTPPTVPRTMSNTSGVITTRPAVIVGAPPRTPTTQRVRKASEDSRGFGQGLISEKSLDEVILAYLSEDAEEK